MTALVAAIAAGCADGGSSEKAAVDKGTRQHNSPAVPAPRPRGCPVTIANGSTPPGETPSRDAHGNGLLWTGLWPRGTIVATPEYVRPDGSIRMKFWWWRGPGVRGRLSIAGRRLDAPAPPLRARIPRGYGLTGFQATAIIFPTEGCWKVTGTAGEASLTFVTLVLRERR